MGKEKAAAPAPGAKIHLEAKYVIMPVVSRHSHPSCLEHTLVIPRFQKPQYKVPLAPTRPAGSLLPPLPALQRTQGSLNRWLGLFSHPCVQRNILCPLPPMPPQHHHLAHTPWVTLPSEPQQHPSTEHRYKGGLAKRSVADISGDHPHWQVSSSWAFPWTAPPPVRQSYVTCFGQCHIQVEAFNCQCQSSWTSATAGA